MMRRDCPTCGSSIYSAASREEYWECHTCDTLVHNSRQRSCGPPPPWVHGDKRKGGEE